MVKDDVYTRITLCLSKIEATTLKPLASDFVNRTRQCFSAPSLETEKLYREALEHLLTKGFSCCQGYCIYYGPKAEDLRDALLKLKKDAGSRKSKFFTEHLVSCSVVERFLGAEETVESLARFPEFVGFLSSAVRQVASLLMLTCPTEQLPTELRNLCKDPGGMICSLRSSLSELSDTSGARKDVP